VTNDYDSDPWSGLALFLLGVASGAAVTLLFAPMSGKKTRGYLADGARQARDQMNAAAQKARDLAERGRQTAVVTMDEWRPKVDAALAQGQETLEQARQAYRQATSGEA
jgi:gas vesicle protein